jgi:hypothetical protein
MCRPGQGRPFGTLHAGPESGRVHGRHGPQHQRQLRRTDQRATNVLPARTELPWEELAAIRNPTPLPGLSCSAIWTSVPARPSWLVARHRRWARPREHRLTRRCPRHRHDTKPEACRESRGVGCEGSGAGGTGPSETRARATSSRRRRRAGARRQQHGPRLTHDGSPPRPALSCRLSRRSRPDRELHADGAVAERRALRSSAASCSPRRHFRRRKFRCRPSSSGSRTERTRPAPLASSVSRKSAKPIA